MTTQRITSSRSFLLAALLAAGAAGCARPRSDSVAPGSGGVPDSAVAARATQASIERHTRELASDRYEGRFPGTRGEELSVRYLEGEMRRLGLAPGNPDGTYVQRFDLVAQRNRVSGTMTVGGRTTPLSVPAEAAFAVTGGQPRTTLRGSELVFVGYGITAPEYGWNDYAGVDVRGKTVLVLRGEPQLRLASDSSRYDSTVFRGSQLTWHGEVERKRAVAKRHGAAGVVLVSPGLPGFRNRLARSRGEVVSLGDEPWPPVWGFFASALTRRVFAGAGRDFAADSIAAGRRGFRAVPLGASLSMDVETGWRRIPTRNVVARLEGSDPALRDEHVIYSAHWDAFGTGPAVEGDSVYNGAVDDAVGVGQMLAVAEALASTRPRPKRSVLFLATSAEEHGLLGARHYVANPLYPLERTLVNVNFDIVHLAGATRDVTLYGKGRSTLDERVAEEARLQGRTVEGERTPDEETWFNVDHFAFVEAGVHGVSLAAGNDVIGRPAGYSEQRAQEYRTRHYHRPSDEVHADWDWGSIVQDAQLGVLLGLRLANGADRPAWRTRAEFGDTAAAGLRPEQAAAIDSVLRRHITAGGPGCVVGVIRGGAPVHWRGYGLADVEGRVPFTPQSVFGTGSIYKQFVTAGILLLVREGRLSLHDDVRKYLPELPDYGATVTIRHLLDHTHGLREYPELLELTPPGTPNDEATVLRLLTRQRTPAFAAGTKHLYGNTGPVLAGVIIRRVTGQPYGEFAARRILDPLGMRLTALGDDSLRNVPLRIPGYQPRPDGTLTRRPPSFGSRTSIEDLVRWDRHFETADPAWREVLRPMQTPAVLAGGEVLDYGLGLRLSPYRGLRRVWHPGGATGYRAAFMRFPDAGLTIALGCNTEAVNPVLLAESVADVVLARELGRAERSSRRPARRVAVAESRLAALAGTYASPTGYVLRVVPRDGRLYAVTGTGEYEMVPLGPMRFGLPGRPTIWDPASEVVFHPGRGGAPTRLEVRTNWYPVHFTVVEPVDPAAVVPEDYVGTYRSDEMESSLAVSRREGRLVVTLPRGEHPMEPVSRDLFRAGQYLVRFTRQDGAVTAASLSRRAISDVRYTRQGP